MRKHLSIFGICLLFLLLGSSLLNDMVIYTPDSARYLVWANSLAQGKGFKDETTPEPTRYVIHAPLYSLLLAPSALLFPYNVPAAKAVTLLIGCCAIFFFYLWLRRRLGEWQALLGSGLLALNPLMMTYATQMLSDIPFALSLILVFLFAENIIDSEKGDLKTRIIFLCAIISGIFLREIGITLMISAVLFFLWKKEKKLALQILIVSLVVYGLWLLRNEIIIAGAEEPPLKNSQVLFSHLYTSEYESIFAEFFSRIRSNLNVYTGLVGRLIFMPDVTSEHSLMVTAYPSTNQVVQFILHALQIVISGITLIIASVGIWHLRKEKIFELQIIFLVLYGSTILIYPINDVRFLFPAVVFLIYYFVLGISSLLNLWKIGPSFNAIRSSFTGLFILLLIPNLYWMQSFITNGYRFTHRSNDTKQSIGSEQLPDIYSKPLHLAAHWIVQHSDSSAIVLTRWKEVAIWLEGRKIIESNPQILPKAFYRQVRDYGVSFVVSARWRSPINEFEEQFVRTPQYNFHLLYQVDNVEVYSVKRKENIGDNRTEELTKDSIRYSFVQALTNLEDDPIRSEQMLKTIFYKNELPASIQFHISVAREICGGLDSAENMFRRFLSMPQAGSFIPLTRYHLGIIQLFRQIETTPSNAGKAKIFQTIALNYWELGYRKQAMKMLYKALTADSNNVTSIICSILFPLQMNDTISVRKHIGLAIAHKLEDVNVSGAATILRYYDTLRATSGISEKAKLKMGIAQVFLSMGLREDAIDQLHEILIFNPTDENALYLLGELMEIKRRFAPAVGCYKRILEKNPENYLAMQKIYLLKDRI
jgi:tetratricopeptide (TPR) repeat protein